MASYIALASFKDQGVHTVHDGKKRANLLIEIGGNHGVNMKEIYWTVGQYDMVTVCEANDDAAIAAFGLAIGAGGNIRLQTLSAFPQAIDYWLKLALADEKRDRVMGMFDGQNKSGKQTMCTSQHPIDT